MDQASDVEKAGILSQILKSPEFQDSKRYRELLQYLVEKTSRGGPLKELEIAQEVFEKDSTFDPTTDPLIRSYVSNLRKKLDHYYLTTEDEYNYRLEIPKGHYLVKYTRIERVESHKKLSDYFSSYSLILIIILSILVMVLAVLQFNHQLSPTPAHPQASINPLLQEFIQPGSRPTLIVLGDYFFMRERENSDVYLRKGKINSLDEYLEYIRQNPDFGRQYTKNNFTFLRPSASWGLMYLLPFLQDAPSGVSLKLASQFTSDDFKSNNVIFIGSFRTMYLLKNFLHIFRLTYSTEPRSSFQIRDLNSDSVRVFQPERLSAGNLEKDYGVVAKGEGPDGSVLMMLLGFSEGGIIQATRAACDHTLIQTIAERYPAGESVNPASITVILAAEGMTQSLFKPDIKYVLGLGVPTRSVGSSPGDSSQSR